MDEPLVKTLDTESEWLKAKSQYNLPDIVENVWKLGFLHATNHYSEQVVKLYKELTGLQERYLNALKQWVGEAAEQKEDED